MSDVIERLKKSSRIAEALSKEQLDKLVSDVGTIDTVKNIVSEMKSLGVDVGDIDTTISGMDRMLKKLSEMT